MAALKLAIALFESTHATRPRRVGITWPELANLLTRHKVRQGKDGPAWSPTLYKESATRGNAGVASLYCLVLDFDDGTAPDALIADWTKRGLAFVAHSTYSHAPDSPRWRAVFPLEKPVGPLRWKEIYQALAADLGRGNADPACKDPARMYYLPAHPPGIAPFTHSQINGLPLECSFVASSPSGYAKGENHLNSKASEPAGGNANAMSSNSAPELVSPFAARNERLAGGGRKPEGRFKGEVRPGADYDARATQRDVLKLLGKHGWRECGRRDGVVALTRPGKSEGISGVLGFSSGEPTLFYCYSSNAQPLEAGKLYSPFALRAALEHGGKFDEAAKALAIEGYGKRVETKPLTLAEFNQTDAGNAERLVQCYGANLRYVIGLGWRVWNGKRWADEDLSVMAKARDTVRALYAESTLLMAEAHALKDTDERQALGRKVDSLSRFALKSESTRALNAMVEQARSFPVLLCDSDQFALKPWLVPFVNGTWDKGEFRPHKRDDYTERLLAVRYEPKADRSEWAALLTRMSGGDVDLEHTLQDVAGYALSGASSLRVLPWLYGPPGTGKSTFAELLQTALGPTGKVIDASLLSGDRDTERLGAAVRGMRAIFLAEAGRKRLDAELLKMMAGSDRIPGRELYGKHTFSVQPSWAVIAVSNDAPNVQVYDDALRTRVMALPFLCPLDSGGRLWFTGGGRLEEVRRNPESPLLLGFVAWAVEGLVRVFESRSLHRAMVVEQHTRLFWEDADPLTPFWEGLDSRAIEKGMPSGELHGAYLAWHQNHRITSRPLQGKSFAAACRAIGLEEYRTKTERGWRRLPAPLHLTA